jgi:hypothetical protein
MKARLDGASALGLAALESELKFKSTKYSVAETQAHLDDILKKYGDVENAPWNAGFSSMIGWAMLWAKKDGEDLAAAGVPDARVEPFRRALLAHVSGSDALFGMSEWKALLANPKLVPSAKELTAAKAKGGAEYTAMCTRAWAAEHIKTPLSMGDLIGFDQDSADLRDGKPGLFETYFGSKAGKALMARIDAANKVAGDYVGAPAAVWPAMMAQRAEWADITKKAEAKRETAAANAYGAAPTGHAGESRTGGTTPSIVAIRMTRDV